MLTNVLLSLLLSAPGAVADQLLENVQPETDAYVVCVVNASIAALPSEKASIDIVERAEESCKDELDVLEASIAEEYRAAFEDDWSAERVASTASDNRAMFRIGTIKAAVKLLDKRRATP